MWRALLVRLTRVKVTRIITIKGKQLNSIGCDSFEPYQNTKLVKKRAGQRIRSTDSSL